MVFFFCLFPPLGSGVCALLREQLELGRTAASSISVFIRGAIEDGSCFFLSSLSSHFRWMLQLSKQQRSQRSSSSCCCGQARELGWSDALLRVGEAEEKPLHGCSFCFFFFPVERLLRKSFKGVALCWWWTVGQQPGSWGSNATCWWLVAL